MNYKGYILILITLFINSIPFVSKGEVMFLSSVSIQNSENTSPEKFNIPPVANNDTIVHLTGCGRNLISGNVIANDFAPDGDSIRLYFINSPKISSFSSDEEGTFILKLPEGFTGLIHFEYYITELNEGAFKARGEVFIFVHADHDCDGVKDEDDLDNDNDGLLNSDEGAGAIDTDNDGITDDLDIDSDNDGIPDNIEWQKENAFIPPSSIDLNKNGWDDKYDDHFGGSYYNVVDTDNDGVADYLDDDSDEDGISDLMESKSISIGFNDEPSLFGIDSDKDGLDDIFDSVSCWLDNRNVCGSNAVLKDSNENGIRDWRDFLENQIGTSFYTYPNPTNNYFKVRHSDLPYYESFSIMIYDVSGRLLMSKEMTQHETVDVSELEDAIYLVKLVVDGKAETLQFIKR